MSQFEVLLFIDEFYPDAISPTEIELQAAAVESFALQDEHVLEWLMEAYEGYGHAEIV